MTSAPDIDALVEKLRDREDIEAHGAAISSDGPVTPLLGEAAAALTALQADLEAAQYALGHEIRIKCDAIKSFRAAEASLAEALEALKRIAAPPSCGCVPCVGQCRSREALEVTLDGIRDEATAALTTHRGSE